MKPSVPKIFRLFFISLLISGLFGACFFRPNQQELNRLEDARKAAEEAETRLDQLRKERMALEEELVKQKQLLDEKKKEVEELKLNQE